MLDILGGLGAREKPRRRGLELLGALVRIKQGLLYTSRTV